MVLVDLRVGGRVVSGTQHARRDPRHVGDLIERKIRPESVPVLPFGKSELSVKMSALVEMEQASEYTRVELRKFRSSFFFLFMSPWFCPVD